MGIEWRSYCDAVTYPDVNLTVVDDLLYLNEVKITPEIRVNQKYIRI